MRKTIKFVFGLIISLALLTLASDVVVRRTTRKWFEDDVRLRAEAIVSGASETLRTHWNEASRDELQRPLADLARDQRVMAAAACTSGLTQLAATDNFPSQFSCSRVGVLMGFLPGAPGSTSPWHEVASLSGGGVLVSAIPLEGTGQPLDFAKLQQDLQTGATQTHRHHHHHGGGSSEGSAISQLFGQLGQALQSGNLSSAQQAYNTLSQDFQQLGESSTQTPTSTSPASSTLSVSV